MQISIFHFEMSNIFPALNVVVILHFKLSMSFSANWFKNALGKSVKNKNWLFQFAEKITFSRLPAECKYLTEHIVCSIMFINIIGQGRKTIEKR